MLAMPAWIEGPSSNGSKLKPWSTVLEASVSAGAKQKQRHGQHVDHVEW